MNHLFYTTILRLGILILLGIPTIKWLSNFCLFFFTKRFSSHIGTIISRIVLYGGLIFISVTVLQEFGFNITALLGAAGIVGVAVGFASQTSVSNIISGFFLLMERPFSLGDTIKSGDITGIVESIDLLSVRVKTVDNKLVRLPNEMVLKNHLINLTFYSIKRVDCIISVAYTDDIMVVEDMIMQGIKSNPIILTDPVPTVAMHKIAQHEFSAEMRVFFIVRVWVNKNHFNTTSGILMQQLKHQFDQKNIIITAIQMN